MGTEGMQDYQRKLLSKEADRRIKLVALIFATGGVSSFVASLFLCMKIGLPMWPQQKCTAVAFLPSLAAIVLALGIGWPYLLDVANKVWGTSVKERSYKEFLRKTADRVIFWMALSGLFLLAFLLSATGGIVANPWSSFLLLVPVLAGILNLEHREIGLLLVIVFLIVLALLAMELLLALHIGITPQLREQGVVPNWFSLVGLFVPFVITFASAYRMGEQRCRAILVVPDGPEHYWHQGGPCTLYRAHQEFPQWWKAHADNKTGLVQLLERPTGHRP